MTNSAAPSAPKSMTSTKLIKLSCTSYDRVRLMMTSTVPSAPRSSVDTLLSSLPWTSNEYVLVRTRSPSRSFTVSTSRMRWPRLSIDRVTLLVKSAVPSASMSVARTLLKKLPLLSNDSVVVVTESIVPSLLESTVLIDSCSTMADGTVRSSRDSTSSTARRERHLDGRPDTRLRANGGAGRRAARSERKDMFVSFAFVACDRDNGPSARRPSAGGCRAGGGLLGGKDPAGRFLVSSSPTAGSRLATRCVPAPTVHRLVPGSGLRL